MDCVVMAGETPGRVDALCQYSGVQCKALIPIAGKPMVWHVVRALAGSAHVERIYVVGLSKADGVDFSRPVEYVPASPKGSLLQNIVTGLRAAFAQNPDARRILVSGSDIPLLTPAILDLFIEACLATDDDIYYAVIERGAMERRFPTSRRSYARLREGTFCGGDLWVLSNAILRADAAFWDAMLESRKNVLRQASLVGLIPLLKLATGTLGIPEAERLATARTGCRCKVIVSPYPEIGMDVDKPFQLDIAREALER